MKKRMFSSLLVMLAVLCSQEVLAGSFFNGFSNMMNQVKADQEKGVLFQESFTSNRGDFTTEGEKGYANDIWSFKGDHMEATSYFKYAGGSMQSYLVSPEFTLGESDNYASFEHDGLYFYPDMLERCALVIRKAGDSEWTKLKDMKYPSDCYSAQPYTNTGEMEIPSKFGGLRVQIAFRFSSESNYSDGIWMFKNLVVKTYGSMPVLKKEAEISFETKEVSFRLGDENFEAPALKNPNNLKVSYSSDNEAVATVDAATGAVNIIAPGVVMIKASSEETADFYAGHASYTIQVLKPLAGFSFDKEEVNYEIGSGEAFVAPTLNNPNGIKVGYGSSNISVANVNYETGEVDIVGMGTAVIKATSYETEEYAFTEASYTINVTDPDVVFFASFADGFENFTEEGNNANIGIWSWKYGWVIASGNYMVTSLTDTYLVSPEFSLYEGTNSVSFNMQGYNFGSWQDEAQIMVREPGGSWVNIEGVTYPPSGSYSTINSGELIIPEQFNGKKVQIGFHYVTDGYQKVGMWYLNNLVVKKSIKKAEAGISYDVTEVNGEIGREFVEPVLNNPNNLNIKYTSSNTAVAKVDEKTGEVELLAIGLAKITATSIENKEFYEGVAEYTINVTDPSMVFYEDFASGLGTFSTEGEAGIWEWNWGGYMKADGYGKVNEATDALLVSPEITLDAIGNSVSFNEMASSFNGNLKEMAQLVIREIGSDVWENIEGLSRPDGNSFTPTNTGEAVIPAKYNGKHVQIAFKYTTDGYENSGLWYVTKLVVKRVSAKADPEISFSQENVEYAMGSETPFAAPELINPNNVPVKYSSSDINVAMVDELTGAVTFIGEGEVKITATSEETDEFKSATASYVITVTAVPTSIEGITAEELAKAEIYDLQGRKVSKPGKGIYVVNGKKIIIK